jgi:hypothetical protein
MNNDISDERQALAHAEQNLTNTNNDDGMLPAASCSHLDFCGLEKSHLDDCMVLGKPFVIAGIQSRKIEKYKYLVLVDEASTMGRAIESWYKFSLEANPFRHHKEEAHVQCCLQNSCESEQKVDMD